MTAPSNTGGGKVTPPLGRIFMRKSVEQMHAEHAGGELKKSLGALNLILLGIGCIIGTGIFVLTGRAAAEFAGPAIMVSFVVTGILCALVALSYDSWSVRTQARSLVAIAMLHAFVFSWIAIRHNRMTGSPS